MRAHEKRGLSRGEVQRLANERYRPNGIGEFLSLMWSVNRGLQDLRWGRKKALRELIGPPEFDGPLYAGQHYVGEIVCGRIFNGRTALDYLCIRGMDDGCFREHVARLYRYLAAMHRCSGPRLPA